MSDGYTGGEGGGEREKERVREKERERKSEREKERENLPLFHVLFDQQVVVSCSCLVSAIAKIGTHMNSVLVLVVMDTTT